jgi:hypothetical protein
MNKLGGPLTIGNLGDFAQLQEVIILERARTREFWTKDAVWLGSVARPDDRGPSQQKQEPEGWS